MLLLHYYESTTNLTKSLFVYESPRDLAYFIQMFRPATYKAYVWRFCNVSIAYLFRMNSYHGVCMTNAWRSMRWRDVPAAIARCFILTCNVSTAFKYSEHNELLLFSPKQSGSQYASYEATPNKCKGWRKEICTTNKM